MLVGRRSRPSAVARPERLADLGPMFEAIDGLLDGLHTLVRPVDK
jgi:hypothetical protein